MHRWYKYICCERARLVRASCLFVVHEINTHIGERLGAAFEKGRNLQMLSTVTVLIKFYCRTFFVIYDYVIIWNKNH